MIDKLVKIWFKDKDKIEEGLTELEDQTPEKSTIKRRGIIDLTTTAGILNKTTDLKIETNQMESLSNKATI